MVNKKKIIVVDDIPANLIDAKNALSGVYQVYPVPSAAKLFDLMNNIKPDLILMDVLMPIMNGYEAVRILKNNTEYKDIPIIFLTGVKDIYNEIEGFALGAVDYIHKPFDRALLLRRIETHLSLIENQTEIIKEKTQAQKSAQAKSEFLTTMSQEIRTPLNAVITMLECAKNSNDINKVKDYINKAENASQLLLSIIDDILDFSKIEINRLEILHKDFCFKRMLLNIANVINVRAEAKSQKFSIDMNNEIPLFILGDEIRLSQIIVNLLTNAVKFTPDNGTIILRICVFEQHSDDITLKFEVEDTGIGISQEQQKQIFSSKIENPGLGLAISKRIVELMGGKIWVDSNAGKGSKFIFTIKTKIGTGHGSNMTIPGSKTDLSLENKYNFKDNYILIAEDIEINREIISAMFEPTQIKIDFAANGVDVINMFSESPEKYDMIFMDAQMPSMDGYTAAKGIRDLDDPIAKTIPIITMTANIFKEDIEKCLKSGMNGYIKKPLDFEEIIAALQKYIPMDKNSG